MAYNYADRLISDHHNSYLRFHKLFDDRFKGKGELVCFKGMMRVKVGYVYNTV